MKSALVAILLTVGASPALAASHCTHSLAELKAAAPKATKFETLNAGQYHLAVGMFVATPPVFREIPPGDGAVLISEKGQRIANIVWTLGGKVCGGFAITIPMAKLVLSVNPKPGETIDPSDDSGDLTL